MGVGKITLGRMFVFLAHKLGLMGIMIENCEYDTCKPNWLPTKISPALSLLGINQFTKLTRLNNHRQEIAKIYKTELGLDYSTNQGDVVTYLRFPVLVKNVNQLNQEAKDSHIVLGDWYKNILYAPPKTLKLLGYKKGSCPKSELVANHIVNLPTHINVRKEDALRIAKIVKKHLPYNLE